ncbi:MAG: hypothetical protein PVI53_10860 [Desulfobacteraceae bacterium]
MMSKTASLLFLGVIPGIALPLLWVVSNEYALVHKAIISIAVFAISFFGFFLTILLVEDGIVRTHQDGHHKRGIKVR